MESSWKCIGFHLQDFVGNPRILRHKRAGDEVKAMVLVRRTKCPAAIPALGQRVLTCDGFKHVTVFIREIAPAIIIQ